MKIVPANNTHIPGMLRLLRQVGQVHHQLRPDIFPAGTIKYDAAALEKLLCDPARPVFIAEKDGQVLGYCFCICRQIAKSGSSVERSELYIDDLCVDENCRRMGIARALYQHAAAYGRQQGFQTLTLNVWCGNTGAQQFYEQMGMRQRNIMMEQSLEECTC